MVVLGSLCIDECITVLSLLVVVVEDVEKVEPKGTTETKSKSVTSSITSYKLKTCPGVFNFGSLMHGSRSMFTADLIPLLKHQQPPMPPIRPRDFFMPIGAFTMAIVLGEFGSLAYVNLGRNTMSQNANDVTGFYTRSSIRAARENAAVQREISITSGRRQMERERIGLVSHSRGPE